MNNLFAVLSRLNNRAIDLLLRWGLKITSLSRSTEIYWNSRYSLTNARGSGSQGINLFYKVQMIESVLRDFGIKRILDIGCGDAAYLDNLRCESYTGVDISKVVVESNLKHFNHLSSASFLTLEEFIQGPVQDYDLVISSEVIFCLKKKDLLTHIQLLDSVRVQHILIFSHVRKSVIHFPFSPNWSWEKPAHWQLINQKIAPRPMPHALDLQFFKRSPGI
jgi:SAM-dependent methyltransferase